jgi:hypothetical protein
MMMRKKMHDFKLGFDLERFEKFGVKIPIRAPVGHLIVVGGSGSGKSTALLYWLWKMRKSNLPIDLFIEDFKASREFEGITQNYAEFENCYQSIVDFYKMFTKLKEGGDGTVKILLIDEVAGLLTHFGMTKEGKAKADEIRNIMSSILMLGRSRNCFLWLAMQRYTAGIFPASSGAADNFHVCVGLGRLTVDGRRSLFAGEHLEDEEKLMFGQGKGIVLIDGQALKALIIPVVSKTKLLEKLKRYSQ